MESCSNFFILEAGISFSRVTSLGAVVVQCSSCAKPICHDMGRSQSFGCPSAHHWGGPGNGLDVGLLC